MLTNEEINRLSPGQRADYQARQAERTARIAKEDAAISAAQQQRADREIAQLKQQARTQYPGSDQDFDADWPRILREIRVSKAVAGATTASAMTPKVSF